MDIRPNQSKRISCFIKIKGATAVKYYAIPSAEVKIRGNIYYLRVAEADDNAKPFTVMAFSYGTGLDQQVSPWYVYRGNAKRWLRNRLAQGDLTILGYTK